MSFLYTGYISVQCTHAIILGMGKRGSNYQQSRESAIKGSPPFESVKWCTHTLLELANIMVCPHDTNLFHCAKMNTSEMPIPAHGEY